jgi:hypothetical protein
MINRPGTGRNGNPPDSMVTPPDAHTWRVLNRYLDSRAVNRRAARPLLFFRQRMKNPYAHQPVANILDHSSID